MSKVNTKSPITDAMVQYLLTSNKPEVVEWRDKMDKIIGELCDVLDAIEADNKRKPQVIHALRERGH